MSNALHEYAKLFEKYATNNNGVTLTEEDCRSLAREMRTDADVMDNMNAQLAAMLSDSQEDLEFERSENGWVREFLNRMGPKCGTKDCPSLVAYVNRLEADNAKLRKLATELWQHAYGYQPYDSALDSVLKTMHELGVSE